MLRRAGVVSLLIVAVCAAPVAARPAPRRIVIVTVDGTRLGDWRREPSLASLVRDGASALLSTRAGSDEEDPARARVAAYTTLGAGARARFGASGTALAEALTPEGVPFVSSPELAGVLGASPITPSAGVALPDFPTPSVAVLDGSAGPMRECPFTGARFAGCLGQMVRARQAPGDVLFVLAATPVPERADGHVHLSAIVAIGPGIGPGLLFSPSTRRDGVVALADVAPTVLDLLGIARLDAMTGKPIEFHDAPRAGARLARLESDLIHASHARSLLVRVLITVAMVVLGVIGLLLGLDRARRWMSWPVSMVAAIPLALVLEPVLPNVTPARAVVSVAFVAVALGVAARALLGVSRGVAALGGLAALTVISDLGMGSPLASASPISYLIAQGARFYGIGNELMGVVIGGALVGVAALIGRERARRAVTTISAAALAVSVGMMSAPGLGAKFGATLTAIPAFAVLAARSGGRPMSARLAAGIATVTALGAGAVYGADRLRAPGARSHIATIGGGGSGGVVSRKLAAAKALLSFSIWMKALAVFAIVIIVLLWRRRDVVRATLGARPPLRAALQACLVAIVAAVAFNDAGVIAAAFIAIFGMCALLGALLEA